MPTAATDPHRRQEVEDWLDHHGVTWEYDPGFEVAKIDLEKSLQNQARIYSKLDAERVGQYSEAILRDDPFPAVVMHRQSARVFKIIDGNHRTHAYIAAEQETLPAYVVTKSRPQTVVQLTFEANVRHGLPTSQEERLHQAMWLCNNGASREAAAAAVNIKVAEITRAWGRLKADERADDVGILRTQWDSLSQSAKTRLANISTDEGFKDAASLAYRANLGAEEVFDLVTQCNAVRSSTRQQAIVKNFTTQMADRIQEAGGGVTTSSSHRPRTAKQTFNMALGQLSALPENAKAIASRFVGDERTEAAKRARSAADQLSAIADVLESTPA